MCPSACFPRLRSWFVLLAVAAGAGAALPTVQAQEAPAKLINPFGRAEAAAPVADAGDPDLAALVFSGLSSILDQRSFNFTDQRSLKSFWVPLHGTENGFTVESYNEQTEKVVVRRGTRTREIALGKSVLVAAPNAGGPKYAMTAPTPLSPPRPAGAGVDEIKNPKTPEEIKQAEYEARMLVSDLLDISMQERARQKALRDAQGRGPVSPPTSTR